MYPKFISDFKAQHPDLPQTPDLELGLAIKHIRLRMGLTQEELAQDSRLKATALKTLENGYAKYTKFSNLEMLAQVLHVHPEEILTEAREWFSGNFFVIKQSPIPVTSQRKRKRRIETWVKRKALSYPGFSVDMVSPGLVTPGHFCFCLIEIESGKKTSPLKLPYIGQIAAFVQRGTLKVRYDGKHDLHVFGNQGFTLRGDREHIFENADPDNPLRMFLAFPSNNSRTPFSLKTTKRSSEGFSIAAGIRNIRERYGFSKEQPLSFADLAGLTSLDETTLYYLEKSTKKDPVIYWDKIEKITQALRLSFDDFLKLAQNQDDGYLQLATAHDRAFIDYRHYLGIRIKSVLFPSTQNDFHMAEIYIEPQKGLRRRNWQRKDQAMIAVYVEDGDLRIEVGKNRKARLKTGESLYFDGSLGYIFANPSLKPCKIVMTSYPGILF